MLGEISCNILSESGKDIYDYYVVATHSSRLKMGALPFNQGIKTVASNFLVLFLWNLQI